MFVARTPTFLLSVMSLLFCRVPSVVGLRFLRSNVGMPISNTAATSRLLRQYSSTKLFSAAVPAGGEDTVIATCSKKIKDLLNPVKLSVTSTNDDPNGSHVRIRLCFNVHF